MPEEKLPDAAHIRKRPGMYIGDTTAHGLHHLTGELIANSIDEFLQKRATKISVTVDAGVISVTDDGAGIPFDLPPSTAGFASLATEYFCKFHKTPSVDLHAPHVHFHSPLGAGLVAVNALSHSLNVESWRGETCFQQSFSRGIATSDVIEQKSASKAGSSREFVRGTRITFEPDREIFGDHHRTEATYLRPRIFQTAHLFPSLVIGLQQETFCAPNGLADLARIQSQFGWGFGSCFHLQTESEGIEIQAAAYGKIRSDEEQTKWTSWANGVMTYYAGSAGTHEDAFAAALKRVGWKPQTALIHVVMNQPKYAGPTRTKLEMPEKLAELTNVLATALRKYVDRKS